MKFRSSFLSFSFVFTVVLAQTTVVTTSVAETTTLLRGTSQFLSTFLAATTITSTLPAKSSSSIPPSSATSSAPSSTSTGPPTIKLDTVLDPAFGVLGAILILTGLPCAFLGHKNRWSSYFLTGFYSLSGICLALILKFGVLAAVNPPTKALRGLFVLSCGIAGIGGGAVCILFWGQAKYFVGALGGFAFGMWIQCFRNGGVIRAIGFRWILYIACGVVGFVLCTIPKIHYHILLASTAMVGATAFMLGVDCYTLVGLKEFYVYNLGFGGLFPKFANKPFPVSQTMQIEIGLIAATALAGMAIQMRVLAMLQLKLKQIKADQKRHNEEVEARAAERFAAVEKDLERWERDHGHGSARALLRTPRDDGPSTPGGFSDDTLTGKRARMQSGLSDFVAPPMMANDDKRQSVGILPMLNLGNDIEESLPTHFVSTSNDEPSMKAGDLETKDPALMEKQSLLADIDEIRKSIDWLKSSSPAPSILGSDSRKVSTISRPRALSQDLEAAFLGKSVFPTSRARVQSMDVLSNIPTNNEVGRTIGRTTSTPLRDDDWDAYVQERQLFTPPSGVTSPIPTSERPRAASMLLAIPESVKDAIAGRQRRESLFELASSSKLTEEQQELEDPPVKKEKETLAPVQILPPQKRGRNEDDRVEPVRTRTFEELADRHRRKMHDLQNPLSQAEKEQAELEAAKNRWKRSKQAEKVAFEQRQAEKMAAVKEKPMEKHIRRSSDQRDMSGKQRGSRSLTPDQLATVPGGASGRRSSTAKVLEWQRYQQADADTEHIRATSPPPSQLKRPSPVTLELGSNNNVPFPGGSARPPREKPRRR